METVEYKNISFTVWDVGGQDKVRAHGSFFSGISTDRFRIVSSKSRRLLNLYSDLRRLGPLVWLCDRSDHCGDTTSRILRG